jgi:hypothetical protein
MNAKTLGHNCIVCQYDIMPATEGQPNANEGRHYNLIPGVREGTQLIVCSACTAYIPAINAEVSRVQSEGSPVWTNENGTSGIMRVAN